MTNQHLEDLHLLLGQRGDMCALPCCALDVLARTRDAATSRELEASGDRPAAPAAACLEPAGAPLPRR